MRLGAYAFVGDLYSWRPHLCPSCRRERSPSFCHLCGGPVRPKTWEDLHLNPPPQDELVAEVEVLAGRTAHDHRVSVVELDAALGGLALGGEERAIIEMLVRAYVGGMAHEVRRRMDAAAAKAKKGQR